MFQREIIEKSWWKWEIRRHSLLMRRILTHMVLVHGESHSPFPRESTMVASCESQNYHQLSLLSSQWSVAENWVICTCRWLMHGYARDREIEASAEQLSLSYRFANFSCAYDFSLTPMDSTYQIYTYLRFIVKTIQTLPHFHSLFYRADGVGKWPLFTQFATLAERDGCEAGQIPLK